MSPGEKGLGRAREGGEFLGLLWLWQKNLRGKPELNTVSEKTMRAQETQGLEIEMTCT